MKKLLVMPGLALVSLFVTIVLLTISAGRLSTESFSPVRRLTNCLLPCWRGIQPGEIFIAQANRMLAEQGYIPQTSPTDRTHIRYLPVAAACEVRLQHSDAVVNEIRLSDCPALRLGDLLAELGRPDTLSPNTLLFGFDDGRLRVQLRVLDCDAKLSPFTPIDYISLTPESVTFADAVTWRGFAFSWRYMRQKPNIVPLAC